MECGDERLRTRRQQLYTAVTDSLRTMDFASVQRRLSSAALLDFLYEREATLSIFAQYVADHCAPRCEGFSPSNSSGIHGEDQTNTREIFRGIRRFEGASEVHDLVNT